MENRLKLNKRPTYELPGEVIVSEYRVRPDIKRCKTPDFEPDIILGNVGAGCVGVFYDSYKVSNHICIKTDNKELLNFIKEYNWKNVSFASNGLLCLTLSRFKKIILEEFYGVKYGE